jgi:general secretion pathway protein H
VFPRAPGDAASQAAARCGWPMPAGNRPFGNCGKLAWLLLICRGMAWNAGRAGAGCRGYTLVELITVLAVLATAAALALPALAGLRRGQELEAAAVGLARHLRLAQWRALATGDRTRVTARHEADGSWMFRTEREQAASWVPDGEDQRLPPGAVVAFAGPEQKVFNADGTCSMGSITLRGPGDAVYRCTLVPATGRVRFYRGERESGRGL